MTSLFVKKSAIALAIGLAMAGCGSDTELVQTATGTNRSQIAESEANFTGRFAFSSTFKTDVKAYSAALATAISNANGGSVLTGALNEVFNRTIDLQELPQSRLLANNVVEEERGLEPLFDSGFESRVRNCKLGGQARVDVTDRALDFVPNDTDGVRVTFAKCEESFGQPATVRQADGQITTFVKGYEGKASTNTVSAKFSDLENFTEIENPNAANKLELKSTGRVDYAVSKTSAATTNFTATENALFDSKTAAGTTEQLGEVSQFEYAKPASGDARVRFEILEFARPATDQPASRSLRYTSETAQNAKGAPVLGTLSNTGDPFAPQNPPNANIVAFVNGGLVVEGKDSSLELYFGETLDGFRNIVRVVKREGNTTTHDCKLPYFAVLAGRVGFADSMVCLVDGMKFPPDPTEPPPPPTGPAACILRDIVSQTPEQLSSNLSAVVEPVCEIIISPLQAQSPF